MYVASVFSWPGLIGPTRVTCNNSIVSWVAKSSAAMSCRGLPPSMPYFMVTAAEWAVRLS